jgi:hypothetical protein
VHILDQLESKCPVQEKSNLRIQLKFEKLIGKTRKVLDDLEEILTACDAQLDDVTILLYDKASYQNYAIKKIPPARSTVIHTKKY